MKSSISSGVFGKSPEAILAGAGGNGLCMCFGLCASSAIHCFSQCRRWMTKLKKYQEKRLFNSFTFQFRIFARKDNRLSALVEISSPDETPSSSSHDLQTPGVGLGTA